MREHRARQVLLAVCLVTLAVAAVPAQFGAPAPGVGQAPGGVPTPRGGPAPPPVTGTGAISGVVIDGTTKQPIAGAVVQISGGARGAAQQPRVVTDSKGRFIFTGLTAYDAGYLFAATKPGYVSLATRPDDQPLRSRLGEGEWTADFQLPLWRLSSISGTVVDEKNEPVVDVPVRILTRIPVAGVMRLASGPTARTDDRGVYRITDLRAGSYIVSVPSVQSAVPTSTSVAALAGGTESLLQSETTIGRIAGTPNLAGVSVGNSRLVLGNYATPPLQNGRPQAYPQIFHPDLRSPARAPAIDLAYGDERQGVDFVLRPVPAASVSGRLIGPPEAWVGLVLRLLVEGGGDLGLGNEQATVLAAADGSFSFLNVPTGAYTLEATGSFAEYTVTGNLALPGLSGTPGLVVAGSMSSGASAAPAGTSLMIRQISENVRHWASERVDVGPGGVRDLLVTLRPIGTVSGKVVLDGDTSGAPLRTVAVGGLRLEPADAALAAIGPRRPPPRLGGAAEATDQFSFAGLKDGEYFLRLLSPSPAIKSIMIDGADYTDRPFDASRGDITGIVVTLTSKLAGLTGTVHDSRGGVAPNAAVILFPVDRSQWTRYGLTPPRIKASVASRQGDYRFVVLPQGEYFAIAVDNSLRDAWIDPRFFPAAAGQATRIAIDWGARPTLDLTLADITLR